MAKKLVLTGNYNEVASELSGRYLCGADGKGARIADVRVGEDAKNGDVQIEFVCEVGGLKEKYSDDFEAIEPTAVSALITLKNQQQMQFDKISRGVGLSGDDKLLDDGEDWMRLVADDHPKSVLKQLKESTAFFLSIAVKQDSKDPEKVGAVYFNLEAPPVRKSGLSFAELQKRYGKRDAY